MSKLAAAHQKLDEARREIQGLRTDVQTERIQRVSAQRGLVPYVRALQAFDGWLLERPALRAELEPILQELGLWEIKLGYDPDKDLTLSVVSPERA